MSGARQTENGEKIIPASRRADGTLRKSVRVREGFIAAEDQVGFVSSRVMHNANYIPGTTRTRNISQIGNISSSNAAQQSSNNTQTLSAAQRKNLARNEKKKIKKLESESEEKIISQEPADHSAASNQQDLSTKDDDNTSNKTSIEKKIKGLKKKLRQIDALKALDPASLDEDQALKVQGEGEILDQVEELSVQLSLL